MNLFELLVKKGFLKENDDIWDYCIFPPISFDDNATIEIALILGKTPDDLTRKNIVLKIR